MSEKKSKQQNTEYKNKFNTQNYDSLHIVIPKGQKATVQAAADADRESINMYTQKALLARIGLAKWPVVQNQAGNE